MGRDSVAPSRADLVEVSLGTGARRVTALPEGGAYAAHVTLSDGRILVALVHPDRSPRRSSNQLFLYGSGPPAAGVPRRWLRIAHLTTELERAHHPDLRVAGGRVLLTWVSAPPEPGGSPGETVKVWTAPEDDLRSGRTTLLGSTVKSWYARTDLAGRPTWTLHGPDGRVRLVRLDGDRVVPLGSVDPRSRSRVAIFEDLRGDPVLVGDSVRVADAPRSSHVSSKLMRLQLGCPAP